ncbi:MAG: hypothetical protein WDW36_001192 [Sanguina aurantia]
MSGRTTRMTSRTSSASVSMNKATAVTNGGSASRISRACSSANRRGLRSANTSPMASAPRRVASKASSRRVMPQHLMRVTLDPVCVCVAP